jgi:hypothetical protein
MSLFGMQFSKKPHSPRPNVQEEKEGEHLEAGERKRKNTNSKNKKGNSFASLSTEEAEEHLASSSDDDGTAPFFILLFSQFMVYFAFFLLF